MVPIPLRSWWLSWTKARSIAFHGNDVEEKSGTLSSTVMMAFTFRVGDDVWSSCIIELYQLFVYEILDIVPQMVTFFKGMPLGPKMVFTLLGRIKTK